MLQPQQLFLVTLSISLAYSVYGDSAEETLPTSLPEPLPKPTPSPLLVFGILTQPFYEDESDVPVHGAHGDDHRDQYDSDYSHTYVAASYVKWLEDGGARSIPIPFDASYSLLEDILGQVDGVLFPGGDSSLPPSAIAIWELLHGEKYYYPTEDDGSADMIPLWGTCLGMEFIVQLAADTTETECGSNCNQNILETGYDSSNISLPLLDVNRGGLYRPDSVYDIVTKYNVTMNNHHLGISPQRFRDNPGLSRRFDITSINHDRNGNAFVSTIEPSKRPTTEPSSSSSSASSSSTPRTPPVYGVQYHPEKNTHEYGFYPHTAVPYEAIDHSPEGIAFGLYTARFLVGLARENVRIGRRRSTGVGGGVGRDRNNHDTDKYDRPDIYPMIYTYPRRVGYKFEERYIIPPASRWEREMNNKNSSAGNHNVEERGTDLVNKEKEATISMLRRRSKDSQQRVE